MSKSTTLMAGGGGKFFGTKPFLKDAVESVGVAKPSLLYVGAANGDNLAFGGALVGFAKLAGVSKVHWPKLARKKSEAAEMREWLEHVDMVFMGGGDVEEGMKVLFENDVADALRKAHGRGAVFCGMSAGSIMLGERWIRWPKEDSTDDDAETFECLGMVPFSLDTHGEKDGWVEARSFAAVRARETKKRALAYGIPSGGALIGGSEGAPTAVGKAAQVFAAAPGKKAQALEDLTVDG